MLIRWVFAGMFEMTNYKSCYYLLIPNGRNSSQNDKNLHWFQLKAFADDKINVNEKLKLGFGRVKNVMGTRENAGYQHFLLFHQCF